MTAYCLSEMSVEDSEALRDRLRALTDEALLASANAGTPPTGLGATSTFSLGFDEVFVKRLPLTDIEAANPYSTCNHFELPTIYSYGFGSAGFGAWRELAALQAVSGVSGFPVQLHNRVMSRSFPPQPLPWSDEDYVVYWGEAQRSVTTFRPATRPRRSCGSCWRIPGLGQISGWPRTPRACPISSPKSSAQSPDLQSREMVHFDAHWANIITDGARYRLVDFGLAMSTNMELSEPERTFLSNHLHYDYGVVLGYLTKASSFYRKRSTWNGF